MLVILVLVLLQCVYHSYFIFGSFSIESFRRNVYAGLRCVPSRTYSSLSYRKKYINSYSGTQQKNNTIHLPVNLCPVDRTLVRAAKSPTLVRKAGDTGSTAHSAGAGPRRNPTIEYDRRTLRQKYHGIIGGERIPIYMYKDRGLTARESLHSLLIQDVVCNDEVPSFLQNRGDRVDVNLRYGILI